MYIAILQPISSDNYVAGFAIVLETELIDMPAFLSIILLEDGIAIFSVPSEGP